VHARQIPLSSLIWLDSRRRRRWHERTHTHRRTRTHHIRARAHSHTRTRPLSRESKRSNVAIYNIMCVAIKPRRMGDTDSSCFVLSQPLSAVCQSALRWLQPARVLTDPPHARKMTKIRCGVRRRGLCATLLLPAGSRRSRETRAWENRADEGRTPPPNGEKPGRDCDEENNNNNNRTASVATQRISVGYHSCAFAIEKYYSLAKWTTTRTHATEFTAAMEDKNSDGSDIYASRVPFGDEPCSKYG